VGLAQLWSLPASGPFLSLPPLPVLYPPTPAVFITNKQNMVITFRTKFSEGRHSHYKYIWYDGAGHELNLVHARPARSGTCCAEYPAIVYNNKNNIY
jgi:hypothetical protein